MGSVSGQETPPPSPLQPGLEPVPPARREGGRAGRSGPTSTIYLLLPGPSSAGEPVFRTKLSFICLHNVCSRLLTCALRSSAWPPCSRRWTPGSRSSPSLARRPARPEHWEQGGEEQDGIFPRCCILHRGSWSQGQAHRISKDRSALYFKTLRLLDASRKQFDDFCFLPSD